MERATIFGCEAVLMLKISGDWYEIPGAIDLVSQFEQPRPFEASPPVSSATLDLHKIGEAVGYVATRLDPKLAVKRSSPDRY